MKTASESITELANSLGITMQCSTPSGGVDSENWPHIAYDVTLSRNGKPFWHGPYKLGLGHVKLPERYNGDGPTARLFNTLRAGKIPNDKAAHAAYAANLAKIQKVSPTLPGVLHSLCIDSSPYFDHESFEEWCGNYGYDTDSRKAEGIYKECVETGRQLARAFNPDKLEQLREAVAEL